MSDSLWQTWTHTAASAPGAPALLDGVTGEMLSRADLTERAMRLAALLSADAVGGRTVAFAERNCARWLALSLALNHAGAAALPLDATLPAAQRQTAATALGAHFLFHWEEKDPRLESLPSPQPWPVPEVCLVKLTSGSTGQPQPLFFNASQMLADGRQVCATMDIGAGDVNLGAIPFGHSYGLGNLVLPLIAQGTPIVCSNEMLPAALAEEIARFGVTIFPTVPVVLRGLVEANIDPAQLRSLRRVISAGAPLRAEVAAAFAEKYGVRAHNFYGASETGGICYDRTGEATLSGRAIGTPLAGVEVRLDEVTGQVKVRSAAAVTSGEVVLPDLGKWNDQGELSLTGRAVPVANIGGKKVDPAEVERALRALPTVRDAWVGVQTRTAAKGGDDFLLAAVETTAHRDEILRTLAARLPTWQVPRRLVAMTQLPRNARGKLDRAALEKVLKLPPVAEVLNPKL
ncbi:MAG: acyl--CoA ligase [Verrucomicrobia bacterium]|nr:acyl--CoA ligase [Verrucomicrobiota bacterium]